MKKNHNVSFERSLSFIKINFVNKKALKFENIFYIAFDNVFYAVAAAAKLLYCPFIV